MVQFELNENSSLSDQEREALARAKTLPVVYDEDSPELTDQMEQAFAAARRAKPYRREPLTLYVAPTTIQKAKALGADYAAILGQLLDKAVDEYQAM